MLILHAQHTFAQSQPAQLEITKHCSLIHALQTSTSTSALCGPEDVGVLEVDGIKNVLVSFDNRGVKQCGGLGIRQLDRTFSNPGGLCLVEEDACIQQQIISDEKPITTNPQGLFVVEDEVFLIDLTPTGRRILHLRYIDGRFQLLDEIRHDQLTTPNDLFVYKSEEADKFRYEIWVTNTHRKDLELGNNWLSKLPGFSALYESRFLNALGLNRGQLLKLDYSVLKGWALNGAESHEELTVKTICDNQKYVNGVHGLSDQIFFSTSAGLHKTSRFSDSGQCHRVDSVVAGDNISAVFQGNKETLILASHPSLSKFARHAANIGHSPSRISILEGNSLRTLLAMDGHETSQLPEFSGASSAVIIADIPSDKGVVYIGQVYEAGVLRCDVNLQSGEVINDG